VLAAEPAEENQDKPSYSYWDVHPLKVGANGIFIGSASISKAPQGGHLSFYKYNGYTTILIPVSKTTYFFPRFEWNSFRLDWNKNPKFSKKDYSYAQFGLTLFTTSIERWRWILRGSYNVDADHFGELHDYSLFEGLIWGAYELHRKWHYHIGTYGYTGFGGAQVFPLIGLDYSPNRHWTFALIFPIDYSIQYNFNKSWRLSLKGRPLRERFRTNDNQFQPRSVFNYSSMGAELNLHYERFLRFEAEIFAGGNFGGSFYIKDAHGQNPLYANVGFAPYCGANFQFGF
jgi:hypothetical protein